jgi:polyphosphate kinase
VPGVSENIRVTSIVGRFLEHSRIYYFNNGGTEEIYLGSADLMLRNIDHRVEVLFPIQEANLVKHLRDEVLGIYLQDNVTARRLQADGTYLRLAPSDHDAPLNSQAWLLAHRQSWPKAAGQT